MTRPSSPAPRLLAAVLFIVVSAAAAACTATPGASSVATASVRPSPSPGASSAASAASAASTAPSPPAQSSTDWGVIWDALPSGFPAYPGAQPTETGGGPASAVLQVRATVEVAADFYREALEAAGYRIDGVNGPLEDGSIVVDAAGPAACQIQVHVAPLGGVTVATILFGAECPFR